MCKLKVFCGMLGGCLYSSEEAKTKCLFALAILHRNSYVLYDAHGNRGKILIAPDSFDNTVTPFKASFRNFKTKLILKPPLEGSWINGMKRTRRIEKEEAKASMYQRERLLNHPLA